jgi:hypothetical protein
MHKIQKVSLLIFSGFHYEKNLDEFEIFKRLLTLRDILVFKAAFN